MERI
jgi:acetyl-CoA acyltransferase 1